MNEEKNLMNEMMAEIDESMRPIHVGEIVEGKVISVNDEEVLVNIGYITDGIITKNEISHQDEVELQEEVKPGDIINVYIIQVNDGEGNVLLSKKRADAIKIWEEFSQWEKEGKIFPVQVKDVVKGGVIAFLEGIRAFIPASQLSLSYVEDLHKFIGQELSVQIIELDKEKKKLVLSHKEVAKKEALVRAEKVWASLEKGEKRKGIVKRLTSFGVFVDLGGVDGLIHLSDLSWEKVNNPADIVAIGDQVEVYVLDFDREKGRIALGLKDVAANPWLQAKDKYQEDSVIEGKVVKLVNFGAFIELEPGIEGLVHLSQISQEHIVNVNNVLKIGDRVKVKVLALDLAKKKISLSIKEAAEKMEEEFIEYSEEEEKITLGDLFKDKLKNFKFN